MRETHGRWRFWFDLLDPKVIFWAAVWAIIIDLAKRRWRAIVTILPTVTFLSVFALVPLALYTVGYSVMLYYTHALLYWMILIPLVPFLCMILLEICAHLAKRRATREFLIALETMKVSGKFIGLYALLALGCLLVTNAEIGFGPWFRVLGAIIGSSFAWPLIFLLSGLVIMSMNNFLLPDKFIYVRQVDGWKFRYVSVS